MGLTDSQILLQELRRDRGLTQKEVAEALGVSVQVIKWAEGRHVDGGGYPRPENMRRLAQFYGLEILDIWPIEAAA
jgi:transcriptional regulator with XRE-family HTH domain